MERVADYIINRLVEQSIKHIFLITGRGILYLTDAVAKNPNITAVSAYHEQGASYAAMAYASASDGISACLVSTGCAATNAVTAALCAYQDNLPVVFISGQNMLHETTRYTGVPIRTYGSQEADIVPIVSSVTKYAVMLSNADDVAYELDKAIYLANSARKGPVWIDVPLDIQNARIEPSQLRRFAPPEERFTPDSADIAYAAEQYRAASRPILFVGGGVRSAGAAQEVQALSQQLQLPVVFSTSAADVYGTGNTLSIGAVGSLGGSRAGNFAVQNADLILAVGSKLCSQTTGNPNQFGRAAKVIAVDIDPNEHTKQGVAFDRVICADAKAFLSAFLLQSLPPVDSAWTERCLHWKEQFALSAEDFVKELKQQNKIDLYQFADALSSALPEQATVITDAGFEELIIPSAVRYHGEQRCLFPASQGAMGYAIPAIIGAHYAGRRDIVTVVGDGSIMMNLQELQIIAAHQIPAKIFVVNNNMYAVIRKRQKDLFRARTIGNDPSDGVPAPDFRKIAACFGLQYCSIPTLTELSDQLAAVLSASGPCLCEVFCAEDQKYFHTSFALNEKKRLVKRPLEDQSPFLDRELFRKEMLIEPIEE